MGENIPILTLAVAHGNLSIRDQGERQCLTASPARTAASRRRQAGDGQQERYGGCARGADPWLQKIPPSRLQEKKSS